MTDNISILVKKSSQFMKIGGWDLISVEIHLGLKKSSYKLKIFIIHAWKFSPYT